MKEKPTSSQIVQIFTAVGTAVALILLAFGLISGDPATNQPEARGVTNFDTVTANVVNAGSLDVTNSPTFGASNMYPLLTDTSSQGIYIGKTTFTGTLAVTAATHGLTAVTAAFCTLGQTPSTASGAPALCWSGYTTTTVTFTVEQDDWTTNATSGAIVNYAIVGTP
jgi:hypothetical protein